jgi:sortase A
LILFGAATIAMGYCLFTLGDMWFYQKREQQEFNKDLRRGDNPKSRPAHTKNVRPSPQPPTVAPGGLLGRIEIPRLGVSTMVAEGTDASTLRAAVGHIEGTALPGESGNVGIAGHRDTFFRPLRSIRANDMIVLDTLAGQYRYRVISTKVVSPNDTSVLAPSAGQTLTLVTCYPFYFVGPAPDRFIVRAERMGG